MRSVESGALKNSGRDSQLMSVGLAPQGRGMPRDTRDWCSRKSARQKQYLGQRLAMVPSTDG